MDPLERLSAETVPPVPDAATLRAGVRRKLHPRLLVQQLLEFALGATLWGGMHLAGALLAAVRYTVTGTWPARPAEPADPPLRPRPPHDPTADAGGA